MIDVNTGKFTGSAGNLEATVTANNLEAAEEIVRQLRLRDIGGIIVIDFIDMVLPTNRELLVRRLTECLGRDRTRHQVAEVTSLGLVQMTRKKIGTGLAEAFTEQCEACGGRGYRRFDKPVDSQAPADGGERSKGRGRGHKGSSGKSHSK
ncbi:cytoplasmic axial filament protein CafA and Ribonuclease G [Cutibacterium acnes JCM 18916]|nr:cytoplasmic axial filament protein CafA and Ribonuclease G [Cutibacterium acnes JCM 18916]